MISCICMTQMHLVCGAKKRDFPLCCHCRRRSPPAPLSLPLQTVPTCPCLYKNSFVYHESSAPSGEPPSFEECAAFLDAVRAADAKVLVHCMSGNSRSPSIALYYLMKAYGQRLDQAYAYLKGKRPAMALNAGDAARVAAAEAAILGPNASGFNPPVGKCPVDPEISAAAAAAQQQQMAMAMAAAAATGANGGGFPAPH